MSISTWVTRPSTGNNFNVKRWRVPYSVGAIWNLKKDGFRGLRNVGSLCSRWVTSIFRGLLNWSSSRDYLVSKICTEGFGRISLWGIKVSKISIVICKNWVKVHTGFNSSVTTTHIGRWMAHCSPLSSLVLCWGVGSRAVDNLWVQVLRVGPSPRLGGDSRSVSGPVSQVWGWPFALCCFVAFICM